MAGPLAPLRRLVARLVPSSGGIGERTVKGGIWMTSINVSDRVLQLGMYVVLARLLAPADFGLLGFAMLGLAAMTQVSNLGLDTALIQRKEDDVDAYLGTVWTMKAMRGLLIVAVAYVTAPYLAQFFNEPRTVDIFRVIALSPLLVGLRNPAMMYLHKEMEFHREFVYRLSGTLMQVVVAIGLALVLENVWALVFGRLLGDATRTAVSYFLDSRRPVFEFDIPMAREMFGYGRWITGYGIFAFLFTQGDDAVVGWALGAAALGFYQLAYRFARAPSTEVTGVISTVMLPAYSKLQEDAAALRRTYFNVLKLTSLVSAPMAVGIFLVSESFVLAFLGEQWLPAVGAMQVLAIWGFVLSVGATSGPLLKAIGRPDYVTKVMVMKTIALAVIILPAVERFGVTGAAAAVLLSALFTSEITINYLVLREIDGSVRRFVMTIGMPLVVSGIMGAAVFAVQNVVPPEMALVQFVAAILTGVVSYGLVILFVENTFDYGIRRLVTQVASNVL
ncbi:lipopolysaccharide biosynthesis protein [Halogeometricum limi]|uniref:Polysaccharide transporter, PST family n=1 Tax=Halogeometricum limi TaxID=555875 RepID=A0A1I6II90_9EURY|nr:lipopolysaccharide biosynthesis protein [Halogeometricum limi]SFR66507.1 polysaccharide transporter, PST family [Halogeometricum limi]